MQTLSLTELRAHLADTLREAEAAQEPVFISRWGRPVGVLMSWNQYQRLTAEHAGFASRLQRWRAEHIAAGDDADCFVGLRDGGAGRNVDGPL